MNINKNGLISLSNKSADCKISLWGGNVLSYRPSNQEHDVFWMGDFNKFDNIQAIRGGIPICWPRFAEEKINGELPRHGFARLSNWDLKNISVDETKMEAELALIPDAKYNTNVAANLFLRITDKLELCLETINNSGEVFKFSEALHAYFNIGSIDEVEIKGLSGHHYKNSLDGKMYTLNDNLKIKGEFDSAFINHANTVEIVDPVLNRIINLEKSGSNNTVVWNPNKDLAEMSKGQYKKFVCVEPSNQGDNFVCLNPGEKHKLAMTVQVKALK